MRHNFVLLSEKVSGMYVLTNVRPISNMYTIHFAIRALSLILRGVATDSAEEVYKPTTLCTVERQTTTLLEQGTGTKGYCGISPAFVSRSGSPR